MRVISDGTPGAGSPRQPAQPLNFYPLATIKCTGQPVFRSQAARDFACLLDVDPDVVRWVPFPDDLTDGRQIHAVDFLVTTDSATFIAEVGEDEPRPEGWVTTAASALGHRYRSVSMIELQGFRLSNAKDLLRYGFYRPTLGDRVRLLAGLDEMGTLTVAECLSAISEGRPMASLAAMMLQGFIEIEIDEAAIGPETTVRRIRT